MTARVRHGRPDPQLLLQRRLVDQHAESVDRAGADARRRPPATPCAAGGTRDRRRPARHGAGPDRRADRRRRTERVDAHADSRRVDHEVGTDDVVGDRRPRPTPGERRGRLPRRCGVRLTTAIVAGAGASERVDHRAGRAAGADHGDPSVRRRRRPPRRARPRTRRRRCSTRRADRRPNDRVDRLQRSERPGRAVDGVGHLPLVRHRHREPADAEHAHRVERAARRAGARRRTRRTTQSTPAASKAA